MCPGSASVGATVNITSTTNCQAGAGSEPQLVFLGPEAYVGSGGGGEVVPITNTGTGFSAAYPIPSTYEGGEQTGTGLEQISVIPGNGYSFATYPAAMCDSPFTVTTSPSTGPLSVEISSTPNPVAAGGSLVYTITVTNTGRAALVGVSATLPLPDGVSSTSYSSNCEGRGTTFTCLFGNATGTSIPGRKARLKPGESQAANIAGNVAPLTTIFPLVATVTASATAPSGLVKSSAEVTTEES